MTLPTLQISDLATPRGATMKFTYASGSRPLEGYTIKRGIGSGGFGEVYYAVSDAGKEVALKLIRRHLDVELRGVRQCLNLKHPNLLVLHDIRADAQDDHWVIMEYVAGENLQAVLDRHPNGLPPAEALAWMHGIAAGVAYLHDHGIVHRDLKPGNIFREEGIVKIGDYGLSKFVSVSRRSGQTESVGTVHYMAPEIAGGRYGKGIDTYAMGIVLYEMLTGNVPFDGESVGEVLMKHLTSQPDVSQLDEPYRTLVRRALAKDPDVRFSSAREFAAQLPGGETAIERPRFGASDLPQDISHENNRNGATAAPLPEEPLGRMVREWVQSRYRQWCDADFPPAARTVLVAAGIFALVSTAGVWMPALFILAVTYCIYFAGWSFYQLVWNRGRSHPRKVRPFHSGWLAQAKPPIQEIKPSPPVASKSRRDQATELLGSLLLAALIVPVMGIAVVVLGQHFYEANDMHPVQIGWLVALGMLGTWGVLAANKLWPSKWDDPWLRRGVMFVLGLLFGATAYGLTEFLQVELPYVWNDDAMSYHAVGYYGITGEPKLTLFLAYFGVLGGILRWWRLTEPQRPARLNVPMVAVALVVAWGVSFFWAFPQPWGLIVVAMVAVATQLASPWMEPAQRSTG